MKAISSRVNSAPSRFLAMMSTARLRSSVRGRGLISPPTRSAGSLSKFAKQCDGVRRHRIAASDGFETFVGFGLNVDLLRIDRKGGGQTPAHLFFIRSEPRPLSQNYGVQVDYRVA